VQQKEL